MLLKVYQRIGQLRCDNVAGEHDFFAGKINHQISAGMCGRPVEQLDSDAVDLQVLFILRDELIGKVLGWRCAATARRESGILFLFVVFVGYDLYARRERGESIDVISVAMSKNHCRYWFRCDLRNIVEQFLPTCRGGLCIDDNDSFVSNNDTAVPATAFDPVNIRL